jgi:Lrp/AsnC family leucine-responsive transcriptional regulator
MWLGLRAVERMISVDSEAMWRFDRRTCDSGLVDAIDRDLLRLLIADARTTYHDLGATVRLSANTVSDRVRRLRASGVLRGYRAELDPAALGRTLMMVSDIRLRDGWDRSEFERGLVQVPQVVSGSRLTGEYDFQLRIACVDPSEFEMVVDTLKRDHGVRELRSRLVLHELDLGPDRLLDL